MRSFPLFYRNVFALWRDCSTCPITPASILNQRIWNNEFIKIGNRPTIIREFASANLNYVFQLFNHDGSIKTWDQVRAEFNLQNRSYFRYIQLVHAIPQDWRHMILPISVDMVPTQGILQCTKLIPLDKLNSRHIYLILIRKRAHVPTSRAYYTNKFPSTENNWLKIYLLPRKASTYGYDRIFQYKILNNVLYLNKKLFLFGKSTVSTCSFCSNADEDLLHLFANCHQTVSLWASLKLALLPYLVLPELEERFALLGFYEALPSKFKLINHILLLFKIYLYKSRDSGFLRIDGIMSKIRETAKLELAIAPRDSVVYRIYESKWSPLYELL